ncbi:MAG: ATP synthase F1 subunit epsilon [Planctomycetota bacterium]
MASLKCVVASPEGLVWEGEASSVVVPAADGELGILPRHAPLLAKLGFGELRIARAARAEDPSGGGGLRYFVDGGFVRVSGNEVVVLATTVVASEDAKKRREALEAARRRARLARD